MKGFVFHVLVYFITSVPMFIAVAQREANKNNSVNGSHDTLVVVTTQNRTAAGGLGRATRCAVCLSPLMVSY